jgi:acetyl esterase
LRWIFDHASDLEGDTGRVFLAGDSAGGNLAAALAIKNRDENGIVPRGMVLIYPVTDYFEPGTASFTEFSEGFSLTREAMKWFWNLYLSDEKDAANHLAAPLKASDLSALPPSLILVSGYDPLRDEGMLFAERLKNAGNRVTLLPYESMIHGFLSYLGILDQGMDAMRKISDWLRAASG